MDLLRLAARTLLVVPLLLVAGCDDDGGEPVADPTRSASELSEGPVIGGSGLSGSASPEVDLDAAPTTYDEAVAHLQAADPQAARELARFVTPSGNIYCVVDDPSFPPACELGEGAPRRVDVCGAGAPSPLVGRVELVDGRPTAVCNTDTIRAGDAPVLGYGGVASWPGAAVQCLVEPVGVTCVDERARAGFFLARGRFELLG